MPHAEEDGEGGEHGRGAADERGREEGDEAAADVAVDEHVCAEGARGAAEDGRCMAVAAEE